MTNDSSHFVIYCACTMSLPLSLSLLVPPALYSAVHFASSLTAPPAFLQPVLHQVTSRRLAIQSWAAVTEVASGLLLIVQALRGLVPLLSLLMYWQFLSLRYVKSAAMRKVFADLDASISPYISAIGPLNFVYNKIKGWASNFVAPPAAQ